MSQLSTKILIVLLGLTCIINTATAPMRITVSRSEFTAKNPNLIYDQVVYLKEQDTILMATNLGKILAFKRTNANASVPISIPNLTNVSDLRCQQNGAFKNTCVAAGNHNLRVINVSATGVVTLDATKSYNLEL